MEEAMVDLHEGSFNQRVRRWYAALGAMFRSERDVWKTCQKHGKIWFEHTRPLRIGCLTLSRRSPAKDLELNVERVRG
jgi:hypothetical protein